MSGAYFFGVRDAVEPLEVFFEFLFFFDRVGREELDVLVSRGYDFDEHQVDGVRV